MKYNILLETIRNRRSVGAFKRDSIPKEQIEKILEAGTWAPSGINSQPWEFIVVNKKDLRKK